MGLFGKKKQGLGWSKKFSAEEINKIIEDERKDVQLTEQDKKDEKTMMLCFKNLEEDELPAARNLAKLIKEKKIYDKDSQDGLEEIYEQLRGGEKTIENLDKHTKQVASLAHYAQERLEEDEAVFKKALPDEYKDIKYVTEKERTILKACKDVHKTIKDAQGTMDNLAEKTSIILSGDHRYGKDELDEMLIKAKHVKRFLKTLNKELMQVHRIHKHIMSASSKLYVTFEELTKAAEEMRKNAA